jgi:hypothetical protein
LELSCRTPFKTFYNVRDNRWSEAIAVGSRPLVEKRKNELGCKAAHRELIEADGRYGTARSAGSLRIQICRSEWGSKQQNSFFWDETNDEART